MTTIHIEIDTEELKRIVIAHLESKLGDRDLNQNLLTIETKSAQNYKSEWEQAHFRATYKGSI